MATNILRKPSFKFAFLTFQEVARKIEEIETDFRDKPKKEVKIEDSGSLPVDKPFVVEKE